MNVKYVKINQEASVPVEYKEMYCQLQKDSPEMDRIIFLGMCHFWTILRSINL